MAGGGLVFQYSARPAEGAALAGGRLSCGAVRRDPCPGGPVRSSGNQTFSGASEERLPGLSLSFLGVQRLGQCVRWHRLSSGGNWEIPGIRGRVARDHTVSVFITIETMTDPLIMAGREFRSRLIVGTGKYKSFQETARALEASGADMVTVAVRRV